MFLTDKIVSIYLLSNAGMYLQLDNKVHAFIHNHIQFLEEMMSNDLGFKVLNHWHLVPDLQMTVVLNLTKIYSMLYLVYVVMSFKCL